MSGLSDNSSCFSFMSICRKLNKYIQKSSGDSVINASNMNYNKGVFNTCIKCKSEILVSCKKKYLYIWVTFIFIFSILLIICLNFIIRLFIEINKITISENLLGYESYDIIKNSIIALYVLSICPFIISICLISQKNGFVKYFEALYSLIFISIIFIITTFIIIFHVLPIHLIYMKNNNEHSEELNSLISEFNEIL
jgi:hypothetical protein